MYLEVGSTTYLCINDVTLSLGDGAVCVQCDSDLDAYCLEMPPPPRNCTLCTKFSPLTHRCVAHLETEYCITERRFINGKQNLKNTVQLTLMTRFNSCFN